MLSCNKTDFLIKNFKKSKDEGIRMVLIIIKKEVDQAFQGL